VANEDERARAARLVTGKLGKPGLADAGLAAKDDNASASVQGRAELGMKQALLARAPDQKRRSVAA
jgi:hypothetical protein